MKCDVLVVDGEPSLLRLIVRGLKAVPGLRPVGAATLGEALAMLDSDPPDLVITEICLGGDSGLDLIRELDQRGSRAPVIVMTGCRDTCEDRLARYPGLVVLEKPMTIAGMRRRVEGVLAERWQRGESARALVPGLRLAALAGGSLKFEVELASGEQGWLEVMNGEPWNAYADGSQGSQALAMVFGSGSRSLALVRMAEPPAGRQRLSMSLLHDLAAADDRAARAPEPLAMHLDDAANRACRGVQEDVETGSCILVDVNTATLVGVSPLTSNRPDLLTAVGAGFLGLFHRALEQAEGEEAAPEGILDEVYLASREELRFFKQVPGKPLVIALLTGKATRPGFVWTALRRGLPMFQQLVSAGTGPETHEHAPAVCFRQLLDDSASLACRHLAESIVGARCCGLLDLGASTLVGLSNPDSSDLLDEVTTRAADLFRSPARAQGDHGDDPLDEVFVSSRAMFHFLKKVPGGERLVAVTTDATTRAAVTWMAIRDALPELAS